MTKTEQKRLGWVRLNHAAADIMFDEHKVYREEIRGRFQHYTLEIIKVWALDIVYSRVFVPGNEPVPVSKIRLAWTPLVWEESVIRFNLK